MQLHRLLMTTMALVILAPQTNAGATGSTSARRTVRPSPHHHRISPELWRWFRSPGFRMFRGRRVPGGPFAALDLDRVGVTIRLANPSDVERLTRVEGRDLKLRRTGGRILQLGRFVTAVVNLNGLNQLKSEPAVRRVELDMAPPFGMPLDFTVAEINAAAVWHTRDMSDVPVTGGGVVIADLDPSIDVMHPAFFRADGGYFDWIDVNDNGLFNPGTDAVDLNGNGEADSEETLQFFDGRAYTLSWPPQLILNSGDGEFDVGWDHLYADTNGNGERDFGTRHGFQESDPAYGEALFLVDDVNGNGRLDVGEKLVALGTSKIRAVFDGTHEWVRGTGLITFPVDEEAMHGTGVAGIFGGGNVGLTTLTGIAPDAEIIMGAYGLDPYASLADLLIWAVQQGADVVLHEYAPWAGTHLDGSTNHEAIMDQAAANGAAQVNPAGNLGGSNKQCVLMLDPQGTVQIPVDVPQAPYPGYEYKYMTLTFHWRIPQRDLRFVLRTPSNIVIDLGTTGDSTELPDGTTYVEADRDDSSRGTAMFDILVYGLQGWDYHPIETGTWTMTITDVSSTDPTAPAMEITGYTMDDISSWGEGINFPNHRSEKHLVTWPSTADSAITVAAYTGHDSPPYEDTGSEHSGQLRRYSCRGTRIDGVSIFDIGAPDNPLTAMCPDVWGEDLGHGAYMVFGGTSGAGPHVAGAAALIKQVYPDLDGYEVRNRIRQGALVDSDVTGDTSHAVQDLWGAGKLRVYESLYGQSPQANTPPSISIEPIETEPGQPVDIAPQVSDAEDAVSDLQLFWDDDYDGDWDTGPTQGGQSRPFTFDATGTVRIKVQVVDTGGLTASTLAEVTVREQPDAGVPDGSTDATATPRGRGGCNCRAAPGSVPSKAFVLMLLMAFALFAVCRAKR